MKLNSYITGSSVFPELGQFNKAELDDLISNVASKIDWNNCGLVYVSTSIESEFLNAYGSE